MSNILLLGDTHTALFPKNLIGTEEDKIINLGIKNINVEKYHKFISKKVYKKINNIDYIIFQIGINDLLKHLKEKKKINFFELIYNIKTLLLELEKLDSKLLVQPIYPTKNRQLNCIIEEFNFLLAKECYETNIEFLDIYDILLGEEHLLKDSYAKNEIKLNNCGYNLVANQINNYIETLNYNYMR